MHWLSEKEIFTVKFSHLRIMQSNVVRAMIVIPAGICLPSTLNLAGMLMRKAHCECYSRVCIKIDESPLPFLYFYRLHFFSDAYELCCKKLYLVLGVHSALRARLISSNKWSEFQFGHGLEVWKFEKQYKKQLLNVITAIPILFPRGKERQVRTFLHIHWTACTTTHSDSPPVTLYQTALLVPSVSSMIFRR